MVMHMATLQVKRVPDDLYEKAKQRAAAEGISLSEMILRMMRRELMVPSVAEWLDMVNKRKRASIDFDIQALMDEVRGEFDGE